MKRVKIYRWRSPETRFNNFGDEITIPILHRIFGIEAIPSEPNEAALIAVGSILEHGSPKGLRRLLPAPRQDLRVWGSGFIQPDSRIGWRRNTRFHAARGELTAARIGFNGPLGDPGILASLLIDKTDKRAAVGFVPHQIDVGRYRTFPLPNGWKLIDPESPAVDVVEAIVGCELIVSSSLHGLITADSFGIPCVWAKTDKPLYGSADYKFLDYATGRRSAFNASVSYADAMSADLGAISTVAGRPIADWQQELIAAFPHET